MEIDITPEIHEQWKRGENIDEHLSYDEREFLTTGATAEEMDSIEEDDEDFGGPNPGPYDWEW